MTEYCIVDFTFLPLTLFWDTYSELYHPLAADKYVICHFSHFSFFATWIFFAFYDTMSLQEEILNLAYLEICLKCKHLVAFQYTPG